MRGQKNTSDKYCHIPTYEIVQALEKEGFVPTKAMQSGTRNEAKREFTRHMIRFRHTDAKPSEGGLFPEIVLVNSHDGSSSYRLMAGLYRLVCANGMIAGDTFKEIKVRHQGDIVGDVIDATFSVVEDAKAMVEHANDMAQVQLSLPERQVFAESAHMLRFEGSKMGETIPAERLLLARRYEDKKTDLFSILNVVQENVIRGRLAGVGRDANGRIRHTRMRAVTSITQDTNLNRALWTLAEKMKELKAA